MSAADDGLGASCRTGDGRLTPLFFSLEPAEIARAKAICADCPVRRPCLFGAVNRSEHYGVWGGQLFIEGRIVAHKRGRGRPRKSPAPPVPAPGRPPAGRPPIRVGAAPARSGSAPPPPDRPG